MTPERFQSRDVKRRLSKIEARQDRIAAEVVRAQANIIRLEQLVKVLTTIRIDTKRP